MTDLISTRAPNGGTRPVKTTFALVTATTRLVVMADTAVMVVVMLMVINEETPTTSPVAVALVGAAAASAAEAEVVETAGLEEVAVVVPLRAGAVVEVVAVV